MTPTSFVLCSFNGQCGLSTFAPEFRITAKASQELPRFWSSSPWRFLTSLECFYRRQHALRVGRRLARCQFLSIGIYRYRHARDEFHYKGRMALRCGSDIRGLSQWLGGSTSDRTPSCLADTRTFRVIVAPTRGRQKNLTRWYGSLDDSVSKRALKHRNTETLPNWIAP